MLFAIFILFTSSLAQAIEPMDNYYANDLIEAVDQAKSLPHHYDYSNSYRYKRTTAQSINLNRLNFKELDETRLESTNDREAQLILVENTNDDVVELQLNAEIKKQATISQTQIIVPKSGSYISTYGKFSSSGILSESTLISTPKP